MTSAAASIVVLRRRAEFLAVAAEGRKYVTPGLILQRRKAPDHPTHIGFGLTASGKVGNAVVRNRARRRLRALALRILPRHAALGHDYVLIARAVTGARAFDALEADLMTALRKLGDARHASA